MCYISLGLCVILYYTCPLFTAIIFHYGCYSEPERLSKFGWLCSLTGFAGIICTASNASVEKGFVVGVILALASSLSYTFHLVCVRRTRSDVHWSQVEFNAAFVWPFILVPCTLIGQHVFDKVTHDNDRIIFNLHMEPFQWGIGICIGTIVTIALCTITLGFQLEEAPRGAMIMYLEVPLIIVAEYFMFDIAMS